MMRIHRGRGGAAATALAALVALAGCSSPSSSPTAVTTTGGTSASPTGSTTSASSPAASTSGAASPSGTRPTGTGTATTSATSSGTPGCRSADLTVSLGRANGTAGTTYIAVQFTDTGSHPCRIVGFPGVSYLASANGPQVGAAATREGSPGPAVVLQAGQMASSVVGMVDVGVFSASSCHPTPVAGFRIYPPNETVSIFVAHHGTGCAGNPPDPQLTVRTVQPGSGTP